MNKAEIDISTIKIDKNIEYINDFFKSKSLTLNLDKNNINEINNTVKTINIQDKPINT